jgi:hypothetical protein
LVKAAPRSPGIFAWATRRGLLYRGGDATCASQPPSSLVIDAPEAPKTKLPRTHCPRGHPFEGRNVLLYDGGRRHRCRLCFNAARTIRHRRKKGVGPDWPFFKRTHCRQGHLLTDDNVVVRSHERYCRTCLVERGKLPPAPRPRPAVTTPKMGRSAGRPRKTHCLRGHPLDGDNLYLSNAGRRRACRACRDIRRARTAERTA